MTWLIVCDGDQRTGLGHIKRAQTLAGYVNRQGITCQVVGASASATALLMNEPLTTITHTSAYQVIIFDLPYAASNLVARYAEQANYLVCLDCCSQVPVDLSLFIFLHPYQVVDNAYVSGYQLVMIRDEFFKETITAPLTKHRVFISIGGADIHHQSLFVAEQLLTQNCQVCVVFGELSEQQLTSAEQMKRAQLHAQYPDQFQYYCAPDNFATLMNQADWCITNGGGCLFESLYLRKATWVLPQTDAEQRIVDDLTERQLVLGSGLLTLTPPNQAQISHQFQATQGVVEGQGCRVIMQQIMERCA